MDEVNESALIRVWQQRAEALANQLELYDEALADAEAKLDVDNLGWARYGVTEEGFSNSFRQRKAEEVEIATAANPLIKRGANLRAAYVWGSGVSVTVRDEGTEGQDVNKVVQDFLDDPGNRTVSAMESQIENEKSLFTSGECFLAMPTDRVKGTVKVRVIPPAEITKIISNPEDKVEVWFYLREYGVGSGQTKRVLYPDLHYRPATHHRAGWYDKDLEGVTISWDQPVRPIQVNKIRGRGLGDGFAAIPWAFAYKGFLESWYKLMQSLAKFAWQARTRGDKASLAAQRIADTVNPGAALATDANTRLEAISKTGASFDAGSGKPLAAMVAAALGIPVTMLLGDPGVTGARAVAETLDEPTQLEFALRREVWASAYRDIASYVIDVAVESGRLQGMMTRDGNRLYAVLPENDSRTIVVDFPRIDPTPMVSLVQSIVAADSTGILPPLVIARALLKALLVPDIDDVLRSITDEEGNFIPPTTGTADPTNPTDPTEPDVGANDAGQAAGQDTPDADQ